MKRYIFITGGVISSLGKGIASSSISRILIEMGFKVEMRKFDPYLNVDPGTLSPYQHGEVFVTKDGSETDLDQGHYERFSNNELDKNSSITSGKIYQEVISRERKGYYNGKTVQVIPHVTDLIKEKIAISKDDTDIVICEVGGTIGDIESLPFIEAIRQFINENDDHICTLIHVAPIFEMEKAGELKTKPIQHSIKELRSMGLNPDLLIIRSRNKIPENIVNKISDTTNVRFKNIFSAYDAENIYFVPTILKNQKIDVSLLSKPKLSTTEDTFGNWIDFNEKIRNANDNLVVGIVGKYTDLKDSYLSVSESLSIAGYWNKCSVIINWINSEWSENRIIKEIKKSNAIVIPGGFGNRGLDGKITAIKYCRENNVNILGICLGMQLMCIEFSRNVLKLSNSDSTEFNKNTQNKIFDIISTNENIGGTLRLGEFSTILKDKSKIKEIYKEKIINERHRHRYEFNEKYIEEFEKNGMTITGKDVENNLVETIEIYKNDFFIGVQFHPEFTTKPEKPNPLFFDFIKISKEKLQK